MYNRFDTYCLYSFSLGCWRFTFERMLVTCGSQSGDGKLYVAQPEIAIKADNVIAFRIKAVIPVLLRRKIGILSWVIFPISS